MALIKKLYWDYTFLGAQMYIASLSLKRKHFFLWIQIQNRKKCFYLSHLSHYWYIYLIGFSANFFVFVYLCLIANTHFLKPLTHFLKL